MSAFCGVCGAPQPAPSRFCVNCGAALEAAAAPSAPLPVPTRSSRRTALIAGGAALAIVVVVGGGVVLATTLGSAGSSGDLSAIGSTQLREVSAVTDSPTESWTWTASGSGEGLGTRADGDLVVVSDSTSEEVTRLDADGTELWRGDGVYVQGLDAAHDLVWVAIAWEGDGFAALDAETGEERWRQPDYNFSQRLDDGNVWAQRYVDSSESYEGAVFDKDGQIRWELEGDSLFAVDDAVIRVSGDEVSVVDTTSGDERWLVEPDLEPAPDYSALSVVATDEMVVVSGVDAAIAYDLKTGEELWTENDLYGYSTFTSAGSLVYAQLSGDSETYEEGQADVFDRSGLIKTLALDYDEYFYPTFLRVGGEDYYTDSDTGIVYDRSLQPVGSFDGEVVPAGDGFYQVFNGELSYQLLDGTEKWARQISDPDDYAQITPLDGRLLVTQDDTVTGYE